MIPRGSLSLSLSLSLSRSLSLSLSLFLEARRELDSGHSQLKIRNSDWRLLISGAASSLGTKFIGLISDRTNESCSAKFRHSFYIRERALRRLMRSILFCASRPSRVTVAVADTPGARSMFAR